MKISKEGLVLNLTLITFTLSWALVLAVTTTYHNEISDIIVEATLRVVGYYR